MTYSEGLIKGIISIVGLGLLWFLIIKPFAIGYSKNAEEKEKRRDERFKAYAIYDEMRELFSNIKIDKATKFHESLIDQLEAGAGAVIEGDSIKVGATDIMPETENKADGEVTLGDMNEERIEPEQTIIDSDHATMED